MNDEQGSPDWLTEDLGAHGGAAEPVAAATARQDPPEPQEPREEPAGGQEPSDGQQDASKPRARRGQRRLSAWQELPILIVVALAIALVIKSFVVQPFFIPSSSMEDTLLIGDKVLVNKLVYDFRSVDRGDVIVFNGTGSWNPPARSAARHRTR